MKHFTLFIIMNFLLTSNTFAQWTTDPANPMITAQTTNVQSSVQSFADGNGGLYTFWRDSRVLSGKYDIYGQHYNSEGIAQWSTNGKVIIDGVGNIQFFHIIRTEAGDMFISWLDVVGVNSPDNGIFAQRLNESGDAVWPNKLLMKTGNSLIRVTLVESAGNYYACMQAQVTGGASKIYMNKFTVDGSLVWPLDLYNITYTINGIGRVSATSDNIGGVYVYYSTGNGLGAPLYCNHMNESAVQWTNWVNVTVGSSGLGYQFSGIGDEQGITFSWVGYTVPNSSGENIYSRRLDIADGGTSWADGTLSITETMGNQDRFYWKKSGDEYYMVWADGRPGVVGNYAVYGQKFNTSGEMLWTVDGLEIADLNTYIPYPEFALNADNTMVVGHRATSGSFVAHKVLSDGTVEWGPGGVAVFTTTYAPFYEDINMISTGDKFLAVGARIQPSGGADGIYISQVCSGPSDCNSLSIDEVDFSNMDDFKIYPNPANDYIIIKGVSEPALVQCYDLLGKKVFESKVNQDYNSVTISHLPQGLYILKANHQMLGKVVKQ